MHDLDRTLSISEMETDELEAGVFEAEAGGDYELESPFDEDEEMELATELLAVSDDAELEQFLGSLFRKIRRGARRIYQPLKKILKPVARRLLPMATKALSKSSGFDLSSLFGFELEDLEPDEMELEVARRFVRLAGAAAQAAAGGPDTASERAARAAVVQAARRHAPGLLRSTGSAGRRRRGRSSRSSGRWVRRGPKIVLIGV